MEDPIVSWSQFRQVPMNFRRSSKVDIEVHSVVNFHTNLSAAFSMSHFPLLCRCTRGCFPSTLTNLICLNVSRELTTDSILGLLGQDGKASKTPTQATMLGLCYEVLKMGLLQHLEESRRDAKRIWGKASHWDLSLFCYVLALFFWWQFVECHFSKAQRTLPVARLHHYLSNLKPVKHWMQILRQSVLISAVN